MKYEQSKLELDWMQPGLAGQPGAAQAKDLMAMPWLASGRMFLMRQDLNLE